VKHTIKKFEYLWANYAGFDPLLSYMKVSDTDVLMSLLDYTFIKYRLFKRCYTVVSTIVLIFNVFVDIKYFGIVEFLRKLHKTQLHVEVDKIHSDIPNYQSFLSTLSYTYDLWVFKFAYPDVVNFSQRIDTLSSTVTDGDYFVSVHGCVNSYYFKLPENISIIMLTSTGNFGYYNLKSRKYSTQYDTLVNYMKMVEYGGSLRLYEGGGGSS
jgi:hypothetical protein